jgi:DNA-binding transcriptional regulator YhcF (GntR family)
MLKRSTASKAGRPLHEEVAQRIQAEIIRSNLAPGEKLGTELELAARYGVSRSTIRQALTALESAGLIDRLHGRGTFVADKKASRVSRDYNIHIIVPLLDNKLYRTYCHGGPGSSVQKRLQRFGFCHAQQHRHRRRVYQRIIEQGSPGVIIHATESDYYNPSIFQLLQHDIP